jgi:predicted HAD superfamily Cof-like phosphohydrolase
MRVAQEKVRLFQEFSGQPVHDKPVLIDDETAKFRYSLMLEELEEYLDAVNENNLIEVGDALGDMLYVILGTANAHGIQLEPILDEIHRSNMTKTKTAGPTIKPTKGTTYSPPDIAGILLAQSFPELT